MTKERLEQINACKDELARIERFVSFFKRLKKENLHISISISNNGVNKSDGVVAIPSQCTSILFPEKIVDLFHEIIDNWTDSEWERITKEFESL